MKTILKFSLLAMLCILLATSCDKNDKLEVEDSSKEKLMSNTGDGDLISYSDAKEIQSEVLYHKSYASASSVEETDKLWNQEMINLEVPSLKNAYSTEWFHWVRTHTGTQTYNGTDGSGYVWIYYNTSIGSYQTGSFINNPGNDREEGQWDYYLIRSSIPDKAVQWVDLKSARLYLKGTDGWFVTHFYVCLWTSKQNIPSTGGSHIHSYPNVWLDSSSSTAWDSYYTGNIGFGRLNF